MCDHKTVTRQPVMGGHGHIWACTDSDDCTQMFVPMDAVMQVEQENEKVLDTVTAVFAATLWDLHERAFEAHGIPHATSDATSEAVCEEKGHKMDGQGVCQRCGHSPFLGGE